MAQSCITASWLVSFFSLCIFVCLFGDERDEGLIRPQQRQILLGLEKGKHCRGAVESSGEY